MHLTSCMTSVPFLLLTFSCVLICLLKVWFFDVGSILHLIHIHFWCTIVPPVWLFLLCSFPSSLLAQFSLRSTLDISFTGTSWRDEFLLALLVPLYCGEIWLSWMRFGCLGGSYVSLMWFDNPSHEQSSQPFPLHAIWSRLSHQWIPCTRNLRVDRWHGVQSDKIR